MSTVLVCMVMCFPYSCRYDEALGMVYMASRLAGGYAAVRRALHEVCCGGGEALEFLLVCVINVGDILTVHIFCADILGPVDKKT